MRSYTKLAISLNSPTRAGVSGVLLVSILPGPRHHGVHDMAYRRLPGCPRGCLVAFGRLIGESQH